jgi:hypothetical protein
VFQEDGGSVDHEMEFICCSIVFSELHVKSNGVLFQGDMTKMIGIRNEDMI